MIDKAFLSSDLFLLTLTVGLYCLGCAVYRRLRVPLLHPVLLTFVAVIVFLSAAGIDYPRYKQATSALDFALGMSVVALGYLLYEQVEQLRGKPAAGGRRNPRGMRDGRAERRLYRHGVRRRARNPHLDSPQIGHRADRRLRVGTAGRHRADHVGRGLLRRNLRQHLRRVDSAPLRVRDAEARGFALGAAAHGIGTARAIEIGAVEGALSGLAMALMGLATALLMPLMERYLYAVSPAADGRKFFSRQSF